MGILTGFKRLFQAKQEPEPVPRRKRKRYSESLRQLPPNRVRMQMDTLSKATLAALDPEYSDRSRLLDMYENTVKDSQYIAEHEKAVAFLITEPFDVCPTGTENADKERTGWFQRPWFTHFLSIAMDTEFWGYTLVEFGQQDARGEFLDVSVFPRHHVRPFERQITRYPDDYHGIPYGGHETEYFLLELGTAKELGKLESITVEVIWKTFARSDWSEYNERYGKPFIIYHTDTGDENERDRAFEMAQKYGSELVGVVNTDESLDVIDVASRASAQNYSELAKACDENIAKMMNGQTGTSDVKAWAGSAEVHERVLTEFTKARMKRIQDIINYRLFPFLMAHGYRLEGYEFRFYGLRSKQENTVDNKSLNEPNTVRRNNRNPENHALGFFS